MAKVRAPKPYTGRIAGVWFEEGEADTDNPGSLAFFRRKGYVIEQDKTKRRPRARTTRDTG